MKICWDNLEKMKYSKNTGKWYKGKGPTTYIYKEKCEGCSKPFLAQPHTKGNFCSNTCQSINKNPLKGKKISVEGRKNLSISAKKQYAEGRRPPSWKGGYSKNNIPTYNTYAPQIDWCEKVRRNKEDKNILEVKCAYCGKWYTPTIQNICDRIGALNNSNSMYEGRLYCSDECKQECPIFNQRKYPKGFKQATSREVQPELRQMVLKRDNYTCQKCGSKKFLHCHHVEGIRWEPLESADIDKCITLCKICHKLAHKKEGCGYHEMKCNN